MLSTDIGKILNFEVTDHALNLSNHCPLILLCTASVTGQKTGQSVNKSRDINYLRRDRADLNSYYHTTGDLLHALLCNLNVEIEQLSHDQSLEGVRRLIDQTYSDIVNILSSCANQNITECKANY